VHVPSFAWLGDGPIQQSVNDFLGKLCRVDVPELMPGGQLRPFWLASMAAVVMYHPHMLHDLGPTDLVCKKVVQAAKDAKICDARLPAGTSPENVLLVWSKIMQVKTVELNLDTTLPDESVTAHLEFMTSRINKSIQTTACNQDEIKLLRGQIDTMQTAYLKMSAQLENATSALVAVAKVFTEDAASSSC
jgi:hypothetical protein